MKCPIDQTEMEQGYTTGAAWIKDAGLTKRIPAFIGSKVIAWKCPKCGKIELRLDKEK